MNEARRIYFPPLDGVHGTPDENGQKSPIAELTADMIFASNNGFALTLFARSLQGIRLKKKWMEAQDSSPERKRQFESEVMETCREINVDPLSLGTLEQQFDGLVQRREGLVRGQWEATHSETGSKVLTEV